MKEKNAWEKYLVEDNQSEWIGVDLDGTLAYHEEYIPNHIGEVIPEMRDRVLKWIDEGETVKIFTARAFVGDELPLIQEWLKNNGFPELEITCIKDPKMKELWDDRAVRVIKNTGKTCC